MDPKVSGRHAILTVNDNGSLKIEDNRSTNGTYLYNGQTFVKLFANESYDVRPDSMIQLGPDTRFHVRKVLPSNSGGGGVGGGSGSKLPPPPPEKVDISPLRKISDRYNQRKMEIETKTGTVNSLRSLTIMVSLLSAGGGAAITALTGEEHKVMGYVISVSVAAILMIILMKYISVQTKKLIKARNDNEHDYAVKYCCPKCNVSFRGKIYENILSERRCPKCKVLYYERKTNN